LAESVPWRNECREHDELVFLLCILPAESVEALASAMTENYDV
jgi:hypothetical protein